MADQQRPYRFVIAVIVLMVGLASLGVLAIVRQLQLAVTADARGDLDRGHDAFALVRARSLEAMRSQCRILVEDARLRAALGTEGIDEATVADILRDLASIRAAGILVVLGVDGRVFAQTNANELRNLDLSASAVVKRAQAGGVSVGSWVIGGRLIDLSIMAIRRDHEVLAYLVVGQAVDNELLRAVATATRVDLGLVMGNELALASDERVRLTYDSGFHDGAFELGDTRYTAMLVDLDQLAPTQPRLFVVASLGARDELFGSVRWMLWLFPAVVFVAIVLASRRTHLRSS
jgi:hypothetical protein